MLDFLIGNDLLSAILAFGIVLIPAVIVHEIGHFLAGKAAGITILEFGIGFPPKIAKLFTWKETDFTLNMIPLGGFVRPLGEDMIRPVGEEATEQERQQLIANRQTRFDERHLAAEETYISEREELESRGIENIKAVHEAKPWPRIGFFAAGAIANFIFAFVIFVIIGLIGLPEDVGSRLGLITLDETTRLAEAGFQEQDIIESINGTYFANTDELIQTLEANIGQPVDLQITRATETERMTLTIIPDEALIAALRSPQPYVLVTQVSENSPADTAGLLAGDLIAAFNGQPLNDFADPATSLVQLTNEAAGERVTLSVIRDGENLDIAVVPRLDPPPSEGRIGIGISGQFINPEATIAYIEGVQFESRPQPITASLSYGWDRITSIFQVIAEFPSRLLQGSTQPEERRIVSLVGVSQLGGAILQDSIEDSQVTPFLEYIALISIALGFTNLLPIPALDGGRIIFVVLELIRGKPIPPEREGMVHLVGMIFILSIGVFFIINDFMNPLTDWVR